MKATVTSAPVMGNFGLRIDNQPSRSWPSGETEGKTTCAKGNDEDFESDDTCDFHDALDAA